MELVRREDKGIPDTVVKDLWNKVSKRGLLKIFDRGDMKKLEKVMGAHYNRGGDRHDGKGHFPSFTEVWRPDRNDNGTPHMSRE